MALSASFHEKIEPLFTPGFGTEHVGPLLYSLVRMTRPRRVLEVGLGYSTPFLAQALKDAMDEVAADRTVLRERGPEDERCNLLLPEYYASDYAPMHYAVDDLSTAGQTAHRVLDVIRDLGLDSIVALHEADFRGHSARMDADCFPLDLVWFDCGAAPEYIDFLNEYWRLINPEHGLLLLHATYWDVTMRVHGGYRQTILAGSIANELKRQQLAAGLDARFEVLSLLEPHKSRQSSVTMVRKLAPNSMCRDRDFQEEVSRAAGQPLGPIDPLQ